MIKSMSGLAARGRSRRCRMDSSHGRRRRLFQSHASRRAFFHCDAGTKLPNPFAAVRAGTQLERLYPAPHIFRPAAYLAAEHSLGAFCRLLFCRLRPELSHVTEFIYFNF